MVHEFLHNAVTHTVKERKYVKQDLNYRMVNRYNVKYCRNFARKTTFIDRKLPPQNYILSKIKATLSFQSSPHIKRGASISMSVISLGNVSIYTTVFNHCMTAHAKLALCI